MIESKVNTLDRIEDGLYEWLDGNHIDKGSMPERIKFIHFAVRAIKIIGELREHDK